VSAQDPRSPGELFKRPPPRTAKPLGRRPCPRCYAPSDRVAAHEWQCARHVWDDRTGETIRQRVDA
jgi:hypothetical protein